MGYYNPRNGDVNSSVSFANSGQTPQQYIASVIQGEAGTPDGQFAVASVIQNRTDSATGGWGDNVLETASQGAGTATPQFSGYNPNYNQNAYNLAGQLLNGTLSQSGSTGNATFYNAQGTNPNYDSGGSIIGGNSFSDRYNKSPSADYEAPQYGGNTAPTTASQSVSNADAQQDIDQDQDAAQDGSDPYLNAQDGTFTQNNGAGFTPDIGTIGNSGSYGASSVPTFSQLGSDQFGGYSGSGSDIQTIGVGSSGDPFNAQGFSVQDNGAGYTPDYGSAVSTDASGEDGGAITLPEVDVGSPSIGSGDVGTGQGADASSVGAADYTDPGNTLPTASGSSSTGTDSGMDIPSAIDGLAAVEAQNTTANDQSIASAANTQAKASANASKVLQSLGQQLTSQLAKSTTQQTATAQDIRTTLESFTTNIFIRGAIIALGLIFAAIALSMFKPVATNIVAPIGRGAKRAAELAA